MNEFTARFAAALAGLLLLLGYLAGTLWFAGAVIQPRFGQGWGLLTWLCAIAVLLALGFAASDEK